MEYSKRKVLHGSLLIAGTAIGAGMLALPIASAKGGFLPAVAIYFLCWLFSMITGLFMAEIALSVDAKQMGLVSMAKHYLGPFGKVFAWGLYLFLFYLLTIAYVSGGGNMVNTYLFAGSSPLGSILLFSLVFATLVFLGHSAASRANSILMVGLIVTYIAFLIFGASKIDINKLKPINWGEAILALPIVFTSFSYQGTVPSLCIYLKRNKKMIRQSIIFGSSLPFVVYLLWDLFIKGLAPIEGPHGLLAAKEIGASATLPLHYALKGAPVTFMAEIFSFLAITTSFIGVTLGLVDFLADGFKLKMTMPNRLCLALLVFLPPIVIVSIDPSLFFVALKFAGGVGCVLLLGFLPTLMIWVGRYIKKELKNTGAVRGGRPLLLLLFLFMLFELFITFC